jgi:hypothetical protein
MANEISNEVTANRELRVLHDRLLEANELLKKWHMTFEVKVQSSLTAPPYYEIIIQARVGEKVFSRILSPADVMYFTADKATITKLLAETFIVELLGPAAIEELGIVLAPAIENAHRINDMRSRL